MANKKTAPKQKNLARNILIGVGVIVLVLLAAFFIFKTFIFPKLASHELETERKFLLDINNLPVDPERAIASYSDIDQSYLLTESPEVRIRKIIQPWLSSEPSFQMTIKTDIGESLLSRDEYDININETIYNFLINHIKGQTIKKTRYEIQAGEYLYEIDIFHDQLTGLSVLETEFPTEEAANQFTPPPYVIADVTEEAAFKNSQLAKNGLPDLSPYQLLNSQQN